MTVEASLYAYTGNPFVDAGIAAILAWVDKTRPEDLDLEDLTAMKSTLMDLYPTPPWAKEMFSLFVNYPLTLLLIRARPGSERSWRSSSLRWCGVATYCESGGTAFPVAVARHVNPRAANTYL
jgi:hypothetical protein